MRRRLSILAIIALLAGCATTDGMTRSQDPLDKAKTGAAAGAAYGGTSCSPSLILGPVGAVATGTCAAVGGIIGGIGGLLWDNAEQEQPPAPSVVPKPVQTNNLDQPFEGTGY